MTLKFEIFGSGTPWHSDPLLLGSTQIFLFCLEAESAERKKIIRILFGKCAHLILKSFQHHLPWDKGPAEGAGGRGRWMLDGEWLLVMDQVEPSRLDSC